jgi:hypothetical protein
VKYFIPNDHPYAMAIEDLAKGYFLKKGTGPNGGVLPKVLLTARSLG